MKLTALLTILLAALMGLTAALKGSIVTAILSVQLATCGVGFAVLALADKRDR